MLSQGTPAPGLVLDDQHGRPYDLSQAWASGPAVLFFYPQAHTSVCTKEACAVRDAHADLRGLDATVVGISRDAPEVQKSFADAHQLPFPLLSDPGSQAHDAFQVENVFGILPGRVTYVIAQGGRIIAAHNDPLGSSRHVRRALKALRDQGSA